MRVRYSNRLRIAAILGSVFLLTGLLSGVATADRFVGFDYDGDGDCEKTTADMGQYYGAPTTGEELELFFEGDESYYSYGCTFCVANGLLVSNMAFTYSSPAGWTDTPILQVGITEGSVSQTIKDLQSTTHPDIKCWVVQATDFTFTTPMTMPHTLGTVSYDVAAEGNIQFILDPPYCGYFTVGFATGAFATEEVCRNMVGNKPESWGSVKKLFR